MSPRSGRQERRSRVCRPLRGLGFLPHFHPAEAGCYVLLPPTAAESSPVMECGNDSYRFNCFCSACNASRSSLRSCHEARSHQPRIAARTEAVKAVTVVTALHRSDADDGGGIVGVADGGVPKAITERLLLDRAALRFCINATKSVLTNGCARSRLGSSADAEYTGARAIGDLQHHWPAELRAPARRTIGCVFMGNSWGYSTRV